MEAKKMILQLPKDPVILLSFVNTQLRDHFNNLTEFCKAYVVEQDDITNALSAIDYEYDSRKNQFI
jgi:hypothetical protein